MELEEGVADNQEQLAGGAFVEASVGSCEGGACVAGVLVLESEQSLPGALEAAGWQGSEEDQQLEHQAKAGRSCRPV